ncbi:hypothetical protein PI125_g14735 [Phytophthora idaei]|nr:hypothetical protein PI125_g14735 [Phytophthora idaei]
MDSDYASDDSMSNPFQFDGSDLSDAPSVGTMVLLSQSSSSERGESDGHQLEVTSSSESEESDGYHPEATSQKSEAISDDLLVAILGTTTVHFRGYSTLLTMAPLIIDAAPIGAQSARRSCM